LEAALNSGFFKENINMEEEKMSAKNWLALIGLACSAFIFNTSEFIPIGLLCGIAEDFGRTEAQTGMLISVYAWMVMLMSLPLTMLFSRTELRKLLLSVIAFFTVFQGLSFLSTSYGMLMCARIGVACTHAIFWSIIPTIAVRSVPGKFKDLALSIVVTGTSIAFIMGMPLGRAVGLLVGWRVTFLCIGIFALLTLIFAFIALPRIPAGKGVSLKGLPKMLRNKVLLGIYLFTLLYAAGYYTAYSYIEPFLQQIGGMSESLITTTLMIFGAAGLLGSYSFSTFYDRHCFRFVSLAMCGLILALALLMPSARIHWIVIILCAVWGTAATAYNVAMQSEVIATSNEDESTVAMSIYSGIFNLGIGTGAFTGGLVCTHLQLSWIGFAGALLAGAGLLFWQFRLSRLMKRQNRTLL
jgi:MFS transporter, DHA1 family, L-arabinose/isopropyl-beta-D-thiogalactopyranoside export protein